MLTATLQKCPNLKEVTTILKRRGQASGTPKKPCIEGSVRIIPQPVLIFRLAHMFSQRSSGSQKNSDLGSFSKFYSKMQFISNV
ncbi:hypothetical protein KIN20_036536 [Parelaphostrongylus tenuis]|uniref:Uncharacterized protein n=1 Tax=Parelaphostrongylus tenuis TaxID=148309 RepID=A0AAD5WKI0_PARTN|nr:hypothetical protein KIN20_036536 [Parelaphostrongylus tenuis]